MEESVLLERLAELPIPLQPNPALLEHARNVPRACRPHSRPHNRVRRLDEVRVPPHALVRCVDPLRRRGLPVRSLDDDRVPRGDLPVNLRDDQPEPRRRQAQVVADLQWQTVQEEDKQNQELLDLSNQILELTKGIHAQAPDKPPAPE